MSTTLPEGRPGKEYAGNLETLKVSYLFITDS